MNKFAIVKSVSGFAHRIIDATGPYDSEQEANGVANAFYNGETNFGANGLRQFDYTVIPMTVPSL